MVDTRKERDVPEPGRGGEQQDVPSEIPQDLAATGSTNEIEGREIVEAEVGGESVADVVATKKKEQEKTDEKREAA